MVASRPPTGTGVEALLTEMTLAEKVGQTNQGANLDPDVDQELIRSGGIGSSLSASGATAGNERDEGVRVSAINAAERIAVQESRLGIPLLFGRDVIHVHRTVFPIPLGLAAAWDEDLVCRTARLAAAEASVDGVAWTFAPMLDISEEPRCGRVAESLGEAPVLAGRLGAAMVRGFQGEPDSGTATDGAGAAIGCEGTIAAGMDIDTVSGAYAAHLAELVEAGQVPLDLVDDTARRVIRLKMRQGPFERPYVGTPTSSTGSRIDHLSPHPRTCLLYTSD